MVKLKAGALQLVTFIVVVIALLLSAFIILIHIHKQFRLKTNYTIETVGLVDKGINKLLYENNVERDTIEIEKYYKSLKVHTSFWGSFEKAYSKAKIKNTVLSKSALVGSEISMHNSPALYLKDNNKPLVLVGHTKVNGNVFLPKQGVKSGNISGESYYGKHYVYGNTSISQNFPKLNKTLLNHLEALTSKRYLPNDFEYINLSTSKSHSNPFENVLQLAYDNSAIYLSDISLVGHIIIQSETKITVDSSAKLTDVILIAPEIEVKSEVIGIFQAFATENISVGENVTLDYPSALVLQQDYVKDELSGSKTIFLSDHSKVTGHIVALGETAPDNYDTQIKISANAMVKGVIYCEQNLELRGTVYGSVYTNNFIIKEGGSVYQNHLFNALINNAELPLEFVGIGFENSKKEVVKWLY